MGRRLTMGWRWLRLLSSTFIIILEPDPLATHCHELTVRGWLGAFGKCPSCRQEYEGRAGDFLHKIEPSPADKSPGDSHGEIAGLPEKLLGRRITF